MGSDVQKLDSLPPVVTVTELRVYSVPWDGSQRSCQAITEAFTEHAPEWGARMITARNQGRVSLSGMGPDMSRFVVEFERVIDKRVLGAEVQPGYHLCVTVCGQSILTVESMPGAVIAGWAAPALRLDREPGTYVIRSGS